MRPAPAESKQEGSSMATFVEVKDSYYTVGSENINSLMHRQNQ